MHNYVKLMIASFVLPLTLVRVPKTSAPTTSVSSKTVTGHAKAISAVKEVVSGGDPSRQLQLEVKSLPREEREQLLHGPGFHISVPMGQGLAMKYDVGLSWHKQS